MTAPEVLDAPEPAPSTGRVAPREEQTSDGVLDPAWWQGLDAQSQGEVAESLPQPPHSEAEWQYQAETAGASSPDAPVISAISSGTPTETDATITWTTDKPAGSDLDWGTAAGDYPNSAVSDSNPVTDHSATITGLTAATTYYVRITARDADGNVSAQETTFTTATPAAP